jgi:hypothetical protein
VKGSSGSPSLVKSEAGIGQVQLVSAVTVARRYPHSPRWLREPDRVASRRCGAIQSAVRERHPTKNLHHFLEQPQRPDPGRETQRSAAQIQVVQSIRHVWHNAAMAHLRKSHEHDSTNGAVAGRTLRQGRKRIRDSDRRRNTNRGSDSHHRLSSPCSVAQHADNHHGGSSRTAPEDNL